VSREVYRRVIFNKVVDGGLKEIRLGLEKRYEPIFLEIGVDKDHVPFLVQSVLMYRPKR